MWFLFPPRYQSSAELPPHQECSLPPISADLVQGLLLGERMLVVRSDRESCSPLTFWGLRSGGLGASHLESVPGVTVENILLLLVTGVVLLSVQQGGEGVPLVVLAGTPEDHDDAEDNGEEKMPECLPSIILSI